MEGIDVGIGIRNFIEIAKLLAPYIIKYAPKLKEYVTSISKAEKITYKYTFQHFPEPFVTPQSFDVVFVLGNSKEKMSVDNERVGGWGVAEMDNATRLVDLATLFGNEAGRYGVGIENPMVAYLDSEIPDDVKEHSNLISVGAGDINEFTAQLQIMYRDHIPIHFDSPQSANAIISRISKNVYMARGARGRNVGIIELLPNPYNPEKVVMILAGNYVAGTQACFLALMKHRPDIQKNNKDKPSIPSKIVEGIDRDRDGIIDDVNILE